jgi:hypothetical protein
VFKARTVYKYDPVVPVPEHGIVFVPLVLSELTVTVPL